MKFVRKQKDGSTATVKTAEKQTKIELPPWKVLIVDDEIDIHTMTKFGLKGFKFAGRSLQILQAMSGSEARKILRNEPNIAVALIDVVMETDDAGLLLIDFIRNKLKYSLIRLIVRTGQPGMAPERQVIDRYDIDDYKSKTELRAEKLYTTMRVALKSYRDLMTLDSNRKALRKILQSVPELHHIQSLNQFFNGILSQLINLCNLGENSLISTVNSGLVITTDDENRLIVQSGTGRFAPINGNTNELNDLEEIEKIRQICLRKILGKNTQQILPPEALLIPLEISDKPIGFIYLENAKHLSQADLDLINIMTHQCASALENLQLYFDLKEANTNTLQMLEIAEKSRKEADRANKAKSQFLANMSHELRTPLNAILGYSELLQEMAEELGLSSYAEDSQKIQSAGKHLLGLINDVLDLSKIEAGKVELFLETVELDGLLNKVISTVKPLVEKRHNVLSLIIDNNLGEMHTDVTKLRQMLLNLIGNATKFTEYGYINLEVKRDGEWMNFCVNDNGIGMTPEQQKKLFKPFTQGDSSITRRFGGTGLGLTITQKFAKMIGGMLWVESEFGHGSTFVLSLPVTSKAIDVQPTTEVEKTEGIILIIDDDIIICRLLQEDLNQLGYAVAIATNGKQGIELSNKLHPDGIILDVNMPGFDGWQVLSLLKDDSILTRIPVILMSMNINKQKGYDMGATDCFDKTMLHSQLPLLLKKHHIGDYSNNIVMIVAEQEGQREMLTMLLEDKGLQILPAKNKHTALIYLKRKIPVLILLDLKAPLINDFIDCLQDNEKWNSIPLVILIPTNLSLSERECSNKPIILQKDKYKTEELILQIYQMASNINAIDVTDSELI